MYCKRHTLCDVYVLGLRIFSIEGVPFVIKVGCFERGDGICCIILFEVRAIIDVGNPCSTPKLNTIAK